MSRDVREGAAVGLYVAPSPPAALVERPRLYDVLDRSADLALTLIVAPSGTGKTVLVSAWSRHQIDPSVRWLAAHDHARLASVLWELCGGTGATPAAEDIVTATARSTDRWSTVLVVEDAHLLPCSDVRLLSDLLRSAPGTVRLVVTSRHDPALPSLELEVKDLATTVRGDQLAFTDEEAAELVEHHASGTPTDAVATLQRTSRGWAAALVLGAHTLATQRAGVAPPSLDETRQPVLDYLLGEMFEALSEPMRRVLLSTYTDGSVTATRAAMLSGDLQAGALLAQMSTEGLLVTSYPSPDGTVYRFHPLLVELVRRRASAGGPEAVVVAESHRRAAMDEVSRGRRAEALRQAIGAQDAHLLMGLLIEHGPMLIHGGQEAVVTAGLAVLPEEIRDSVPQLLGVMALQHRSAGDASTAAAMIDRAHDALDRVPLAFNDIPSRWWSALRADVLLLDLWQARLGWKDPADIVAAAREALGCRHDDPDDRGHRAAYPVSPERLAWLMIELGAAELWLGEVDRADIHIAEAIVSAEAADDTGLLAVALSYRALVETIAGEFQTAAATARAVLDLAQDVGMERDMCAARASVVIAWAAIYRLEFDEADAALGHIVANGLPRGDAMLSMFVTLVDARLLIESGRLDEARRELARFPSIPGQPPRYLLRIFSFVRWQTAMLVGDTATAHAQRRTLADAGFTEESRLFDAVALGYQGRLRDAVDALDNLLRGAGPRDSITAAAVASARVSFLIRLGDLAAARTGLLDLLTRVAPQQMLYVMSISVTTSNAFLGLLDEEMRRADAHPFAATAHARLSERTSRHPEWSARSRQPTSRIAEARRHDRSRDATVDGYHVSLTAREADVLEQLALGSSYAEIGLALYITENTVKTHLSSLYRKLGVERRSAALRVARELGLL